MNTICMIKIKYKKVKCIVCLKNRNYVEKKIKIKCYLMILCTEVGGVDFVITK